MKAQIRPESGKWSNRDAFRLLRRRRVTGTRGKGARIQEAKVLGCRSCETEPDVGVADARIEVVAKSCPHEPGAVAPGTAAINPVRAFIGAYRIYTTLSTKTVIGTKPVINPFRNITITSYKPNGLAAFRPTGWVVQPEL